MSITPGSPILPGMNSINTAINDAPNQVRRFILENQPVRGYWVDLDSAWQALRAHQHYSPAVQSLLGEAVSASVLLAAAVAENSCAPATPLSLTSRAVISTTALGEGCGSR